MSVQTKEKVDVAAEEREAVVTHDEIAARAYEIHLSEDASDELENWLRAERELIAERELHDA